MGPGTFHPQPLALAERPGVPGLFFLVVATLASGAVFYRVAERWSLFDSFYFSIITLTTIGYIELRLGPLRAQAL
jgi:hypothetical protein